MLALTFIIFGAQLTGVPPALSWHFTTAAFCLGGIEGLGYRTLSIFEVGEAEALTGIWSKESKHHRPPSWSFKKMGYFVSDGTFLTG